MDTRKSEVITMDAQDAKLRIYISLKNVYRHFMNNNRINEAQQLVKAFRIDFASDDGAGAFLYKTISEINDSLILAAKNIKQLAIIKKENEDILKKELSIHLFAKTNQYIKNIKLPVILTYSGEYMVLKKSLEDPMIARQPIDNLKNNYNLAIAQLNTKIDKLDEDFHSEIDKLFNSLIVDDSENTKSLLESYKIILQKTIKIKLSEVKAECSNTLLLLKYIDFNHIYKTILTSVGLCDTDNSSKQMVNFISSMLHVNNLIKNIPEHYDYKSKIDESLFFFPTFINSNNKNNHIDLLTKSIIALEKINKKIERKSIINKKLAALCEQENKIFLDHAISASEGFFYNLKENLNLLQDSDLNDKLYEIIFTSNLSPDNNQLNKLFNTHASLIKHIRALQHSESTLFDMDEYSAINEEISKNDDSAHLSYRDTQIKINKILKLYHQLLQGETIAESELNFSLPETHAQNNEGADKINIFPLQNIPSHETTALQENIKLLEKNSKLKLKNARLRLEYSQLNQVNAQLKLNLDKANTENNKHKSEHFQLRQQYDQLKLAQINIENDYNQIKYVDSEIKAEQIELMRFNTQLRIQNSNFILDKIINNFNLFYKDYRKHTYKGFLGIFAAHGNKGRETSLNFKNAFETKMNTLQIENSLDLVNAIRMIQVEFIKLVNEQSENLKGNYRAHSFKTYLLSFNNYLNDCIQNPIAIAQNNLVKNYHDSQFVENKNISIKDIYEKTFLSIENHLVINEAIIVEI